MRYEALTSEQEREQLLAAGLGGGTVPDFSPGTVPFISIVELAAASG